MTRFWRKIQILPNFPQKSSFAGLTGPVLCANAAIPDPSLRHTPPIRVFLQ
jgi:hypothetical protein